MATARATATCTSTGTGASASTTSSVVPSSVISAAFGGFLFSPLVMGIYKTVGVHMIAVSYEESAPPVVGDHTVHEIRLDYENKRRG